MTKKKDNKIVIDLDKVDSLVKRGKDIFLEPEAEDEIVRLLELQEKIENAIDLAKEEIEQAALEENPNFSSIRSDRLRIYYRRYGSKYMVDTSRLNEVPSELLKEKKRYYPKSKEVEKWVEKHGTLPVGIDERERNKKISLTKRDE